MDFLKKLKKKTATGLLAVSLGLGSFGANAANLPVTTLNYINNSIESITKIKEEDKRISFEKSAIKYLKSDAGAHSIDLTKPIYFKVPKEHELEKVLKYGTYTLRQLSTNTTLRIFFVNNLTSDFNDLFPGERVGVFILDGDKYKLAYFIEKVSDTSFKILNVKGLENPSVIKTLNSEIKELEGIVNKFRKDVKKVKKATRLESLKSEVISNIDEKKGVDVNIFKSEVEEIYSSKLEEITSENSSSKVEKTTVNVVISKLIRDTDDFIISIVKNNSDLYDSNFLRQFIEKVYNFDDIKKKHQLMCVDLDRTISLGELNKARKKEQIVKNVEKRVTLIESCANSDDFKLLNDKSISENKSLVEILIVLKYRIELIDNNNKNNIKKFINNLISNIKEKKLENPNKIIKSLKSLISSLKSDEKLLFRDLLFELQKRSD